jgi:aminoglycoside phosphotransferase (APT) family kinase protein
VRPGRIVAALAARLLETRVVSVTPIRGKGTVNRVYTVRAADGRTIIARANDDPGKRRVYEKERWCLERAAEIGVSVPRPLAIDESGGWAVSFQSFVPGETGTDSPLPIETLWHTLGSVIRRVNAIPVAGFGEDADDLATGRPGETWQRFVEYNLGELGPDDPLRALGVLTAAQSERAASLFMELGKRPFVFGLCHGDVSLRNVLVAADGALTLLDWECAEAHIVPHYELIRLRHAQLGLTEPAWEAFLAGYGLSADTLAALQPELDALALLKAVDLTRWAIDRNPARIATCARDATRLARRILRD